MAHRRFDVALNNLALKSHQMDVARQELDEMLELTKGRVLVKAVFEHSIFDDDEKEAVLKTAEEQRRYFYQDPKYALRARRTRRGRAVCRQYSGPPYRNQDRRRNQDAPAGAGSSAAGASRLGLTATAKIAAEAGIH